MKVNPNAQRFKQMTVPRQPREMARLKVVQGPDYGSVFVLTGPVVEVGRGEDNDVVLTDLKASRIHFSLKVSPQGWMIQDAGSANGVLLNQKAVKSSRIMSGETIRLGETLLEFVVAEVGTMILTAPPKSSEQLNSEQRALDLQRQKVQKLGAISLPIGKAIGPSVGISGGGGGNGRMGLILAAGAVAAFLFLMPEEKPTVKKKAAAPTVEPRDIASLMATELSPENRKAMETFFRAGFREYREGNFLRARSQFDTILQIDPTHALARLYSANCDSEIDRLVRYHKESGARNLVLGRKKEARSHFEAVMRLRSRDQSQGEYREALEQLQKLGQEESPS